MGRKKRTAKEIQHNKEVGERVRRARLRTNSEIYSPLLQRELADLASVSVKTIQKIETGRGGTTTFTIRELAIALKVKVNWLINGNT